MLLVFHLRNIFGVRLPHIGVHFWFFLSANSFNNSPIHKSAPNENPFLDGFKKGHFDGLADEGKSLRQSLLWE